MSETTPGGRSGSLELARVELEDGIVVRRHHDQLISRTAEPLCPSPTAQRAGHSNEGSVVSVVAVPDVNSPK